MYSFIMAYLNHLIIRYYLSFNMVLLIILLIATYHYNKSNRMKFKRMSMMSTLESVMTIQGHREKGFRKFLEAPQIFGYTIKARILVRQAKH